ncbi:hypothetical protein [Cohnella soli]|uniref:Uncharacterized protein n=1 Tax=Cohnella soli TaxID=425005 RepID=A0ABW0HPE7_9BACL
MMTVKVENNNLEASAMMTVKTKVAQAIQAVRKSRKLKMLRMDVLFQFGFLALGLWIIVENAPLARTAFSMVLNAGRDAVLGVFADIGNL